MGRDIFLGKQGGYYYNKGLTRVYATSNFGMFVKKLNPSILGMFPTEIAELILCYKSQLDAPTKNWFTFLRFLTRNQRNKVTGLIQLEAQDYRNVIQFSVDSFGKNSMIYKKAIKMLNNY